MVMVLPLFCDLPGTVLAGSCGTPHPLAGDPFAAGEAGYPQHRQRGGTVEDMGDAGGGGGLQLQTLSSLGAGRQAGVTVFGPAALPGNTPGKGCGLPCKLSH